MTDFPSLAAVVARTKREIQEDVADGTVPPTVATFSELHNFVDANTYGGMCDEGFPERFASTDDWIHFCNDVSTVVDLWLKAGRPNNERTYLVGMPVVVTVTDAGEVRFAVDLGDVFEAVSEADAEPDVDDTVLSADAHVALEAVRTRKFTVAACD